MKLCRVLNAMHSYIHAARSVVWTSPVCTCDVCNCHAINSTIIQVKTVANPSLWLSCYLPSMSPLTQQPASPVPTEARAPPLSPSSNGLFNGCRPLLSSLWLSINDFCKNLALLLPLPLSLLPLIYSTSSRNFPYQVTTSVVAVG